MGRAGHLQNQNQSRDRHPGRAGFPHFGRRTTNIGLAAMLAGNPGHFPAGASFLVQVVGPRAADIWVIGVVGEERLTLPGGELATLKLVRNPSREFDQRLELWMAPSLGYLPARLRITETNGDYVDQKWLATEPQP